MPCGQGEEGWGDDPGRDNDAETVRVSGRLSNLAFLDINCSWKEVAEVEAGVNVVSCDTITEHKSNVIGFSRSEGHFGSSEEDRLEGVSGHEEYQEEAGAADRWD